VKCHRIISVRGRALIFSITQLKTQNDMLKDLSCVFLKGKSYFNLKKEKKKKKKKGIF
jgi:hypothetical protein